MRGSIEMKNFEKMSRSLSWNSPIKSYYSDTGKVICPACNTNVNVRDLVEKKGIITCKNCNN